MIGRQVVATQLVATSCYRRQKTLVLQWKYQRFGLGKIVATTWVATFGGLESQEPIGIVRSICISHAREGEATNGEKHNVFCNARISGNSC